LAHPELAPKSSRAPATAFNFGPAVASNRSVAELVDEILQHWPGRWEDRSLPQAMHEASLLNLATDKAYHLLGWRPVWDFATSIKHTVDWYRAAADAERGTQVNQRALASTREQITQYQSNALAQGLPWMVAS